MTGTGPIDLRSDTVTRPTEQMRQAMQAAEVGDDNFGEDPTVTQLETIAAARLGKEAALFVPSGTMANSTALIAHLEGAPDGSLVVHESRAHMFSAGRDRFARAMFDVECATVDTEWGVISPADLGAAIDSHPQARPHLLCIENTHNYRCGGAWTAAQVADLSAAARAAGMRVHCDGARIFNAAVAQSVPAADLVRSVDSVMFCISKGLSAPVGSLLCGNGALIDSARQVRKIHGGSMRQAGVIAAAGIVALDGMVERLADDHANAATLRNALAGIEGIELPTPPIPTNFVVIDAAGRGWSSEELLKRLADEGVLAIARPPSRARLVFNRHVGSERVDRVAAAVHRIAA